MRAEPEGERMIKFTNKYEFARTLKKVVGITGTGSPDKDIVYLIWTAATKTLTLSAMDGFSLIQRCVEAEGDEPDFAVALPTTSAKIVMATTTGLAVDGSEIKLYAAELNPYARLQTIEPECLSVIESVIKRSENRRAPGTKGTVVANTDTASVFYDPKLLIKSLRGLDDNGTVETVLDLKDGTLTIHSELGDVAVVLPIRI